MNIYANVALFFESILAFFALYSVFYLYKTKSQRPILFSGFIFFFLFFGLVAVLIGGEYAILAVSKVILFSIIISYAINRPLIASWVLLASLCITLFAQAVDGNVLNKLSTIPFLVLVCLFIQLKNVSTRIAFYLLTFALTAEFIQAIALESRGLLIASTITTFLLFLSARLVRNTVIISAIILPVFYPLFLTFVYQELVTDSGVFTATSSNFERSAMAAWSVDNFFQYPLVGPGYSLFSEEMNSIKISYGQSVADLYDPHQFLLSTWISLGGITTCILYFLWCYLWLSAHCRSQLILSEKIRTYGILGIFSVLTFTLSPPDSTARVQVALLAGIAICGLRDPFVLSKMSISNA